MKRYFIRALTVLLVTAVSTVVYNCAGGRSMGKVHPVAVEKPACSQCHTDEYAAMEHTADFSATHRIFAAQRQQACYLCHRESFCSDCHANKEEIKPSDKYKDAPERFLPHRGDYLNQHMIDGRINPALCFKCHGRKNNERCRACHR
ncbi:MAG: cytochrome C [Nitrospiraceae bacterium]|nr:MAG: cytochrome C [Nitrospiraceae bacterium]